MYILHTHICICVCMYVYVCIYIYIYKMYHYSISACSPQDQFRERPGAEACVEIWVMAREGMRLT